MQFKRILGLFEVLVLDTFAGIVLVIDLDKTLIIAEILFALMASVYTIIKIIDWFLKKRKHGN